MLRTRKLNQTALILGGATAGLLATALFPPAAAFADDYSWVQDPSVHAQIDYTNALRRFTKMSWELTIFSTTTPLRPLRAIRMD